MKNALTGLCFYEVNHVSTVLRSDPRFADLRGGLDFRSNVTQPVTSRVIGRDKKGIEIGGQLALTLQPGVYELRITVSDSKSKQTAKRTVAFAMEG